MVKNIAIVIVLFQPSKRDIANIQEISKICFSVVIDNSQEKSIDCESTVNLHYIYNGNNVGIAEAQNIGINYLISKGGIDYIVFLDQDSRIEEDYLGIIKETYIKIRSFEPNLALLGPTAINARSQEEYKSIFHPKKTIDKIFIPQREIISSGSCVSIDVLKKVGTNLSWLFIDYVDFEWCWRANSMGYVCGTTPCVHIQHSVGQIEYYIGSYIIIISSPIRYFYQGRNYIKLLKVSHVPFQWKLTNMVKTLLRLFYLPFVPKVGLNCWRQLIRGLYVGIVGKI